ncbi:MAG: translation initiation factor IF-2 [Armatimonadota bacterium]|nr:translation initiation factor IF-2 [Armatimonadota bacterium]MDR5688718.1 translation initiation factor IF-2 [Armatimonadota bacterium]MDR7390341.1 translation initiation factor IF-2 [Armatimonadota bacterium]MDR7390861.1 translation initiation factor IF-2 [Armatimonadota bacterium]MDR7395707.1 translation initiation factor IF-2 [Armatimonadota bacterium]
MRLHELAKALGVSTKEAADRLAALGHEVKANPQAAVPEAALRALREQHPDLHLDGGTRTPAKAKKPAAPPPPPEPTGPKRRIIKRAEEVAREREEQERLAAEAARRAAEEAARLAEEQLKEAAAAPPPPAPPEPAPAPAAAAAPAAPPAEAPKPSSVPLPERHAEPAVTISPEVLKKVAQPRPEVRKPPPPPPSLRQVRKPPPPPPTPRVRQPVPPEAPPAAPPPVAAEVRLDGSLTVGELAQRLGVPAAEVVKRLIEVGVLAGVNQQIPLETAKAVAEALGARVVTEGPKGPAPVRRLQVAQEGQARPPVVTVLGHVDHGKTTLLDTIRHTNVAAGEFGGITQHIGAYQVERDGRRITFIDTPGHEAFTALRARGAQVTDIAVLVVAADDGVMPQTVEAINHAKAAGVPIVVAINKVDLPQANPDRVKQQLAELGLVPEDWGGDVVMVPVSARTGQGIDDLLEMILLVAELHELRADPDKPARGTVLEAKLDRGRGPVATVLVQEGTLRVGDAVVVGEVYGKVRAMTDDRGQRLQEAGPSTPVEVVGLSDVPTAGDLLEVVPDERRAKAVAEERRERRRAAELAQARKGSLEELVEVRELRLIVKADVHGSLEAITGALQRLQTEEVKINVLHAAVGAVTESDVMLAAASRAVVLGFNVRPDPAARKLAEQEGVDVRLYRIIYEALDDVQALVKGLAAPKVTEVVLGRAEVRRIFHISRVGTVAGCYVVDGRISRSAQVRLIRDGAVVYEGRLASLRRFKDDVREVAAGFECGMVLENFQDIKEGDVIEAYAVQEQAAG